MRAGHHFQLWEGVLHAGRVHYWRGGAGDLQEECAESHCCPRPHAGGTEQYYCFVFLNHHSLFLRFHSYISYESVIFNFVKKVIEWFQFFNEVFSVIFLCFGEFPHEGTYADNNFLNCVTVTDPCSKNLFRIIKF